MNKYIFMIYLSFKSTIMYRTEALFRIIQTVIVLSVQVFLWKTLYANGTDTEISLRSMITYLILSTAAGIVLLDTGITQEIGRDVRDGSISVHLSKPLSYMLSKWAQLMGRLLFLIIFNVLPMFIIGILLFGFSFPNEPYELLLAGLLTINAFLIFTMIYFIAGLSAFWFMEVHGAITLMLRSLTRLLSGALIPLWYFPVWLKSIADILPVRLGFDFPLSVYFGRLDKSGILEGVFAQICWIIVLGLLGNIVWKIAARKLVIQGG